MLAQNNPQTLGSLKLMCEEFCSLGGITSQSSKKEVILALLGSVYTVIKGVTVAEEEIHVCSTPASTGNNSSERMW